ncbi:MAG: DnaJ domain-containing protein [Sandaracinaceae bacterium]
MPARIDGKTLAELSDEELDQELRRRRRQRGAEAVDDRPAGPGRALGDTARALARSFFRRRDDPPKSLEQCYANLELAPGASLEELRRSYRRLMRRYDPDKHVDDPEKHAAARELSRELTRAYRRVLDHLEG